MLITKLHEFADRIGVKPAVFDTFIAAVVLAAFNWIAYGGPLEVDQLRLAVGLLILGLVGVAAPAAAGISQAAVKLHRRELRNTTQDLK